MSDLPSFLRTTAEEAAVLAGEYLQKVFRGQMDIDYKRDRHDLVTEHDRAAEELIVPFLLERDPSWRIIGEEGGAQGGDGPVTWYVDPIDGTSNFAQGLAFFCVSIGVAVDGELVAGAIFDPIARRLFSADHEHAYLDGEILRTPATQPAAAATMITGYPTARDLEADRETALGHFGDLAAAFSSLRRTGSGALTLAHVAAGWVDCAFGGSVNPWDVAAGALIVQRAGGSYQPLLLEAGVVGEHLAPSFVAQGPGAQYPALDHFVEHFTRVRVSS